MCQDCQANKCVLSPNVYKHYVSWNPLPLISCNSIEYYLLRTENYWYLCHFTVTKIVLPFICRILYVQIYDIHKILWNIHKGHFYIYYNRPIYIHIYAKLLIKFQLPHHSKIPLKLCCNWTLCFKFASFEDSLISTLSLIINSKLFLSEGKLNSLIKLNLTRIDLEY